MPLLKLPETELLMMRILWDHGEQVSSDTIVSEFGKHKNWERSAILTTLHGLKEKGFLRSPKNGRYNCYSAIITGEQYLSFIGKSFLETICGNSVKKLVATLYQNKDISKEDLEELRRFIEEVE